MAINITLYADSALTTPYNGASQWFKILWKGAIGTDDVYGVQISNLGKVLNWVYCSATTTTTTSTTTSAPTTTTTTTIPTTTTTTTATPTTTTTTTTSSIVCENWEIINGVSDNVIDYIDCSGNFQQLNLLAEEIVGCFSVDSNGFGPDIPFLGTQPYTFSKCPVTTTITTTPIPPTP
jgi:hypothetical protein